MEKTVPASFFLFMLSGDPVEIKKPFPNGNGIKFKMEAWMGFEPIHRGFANRSLNPLSTTPKELLIPSMPFNIPVF